jgi:pimeloyl-ACP methyl ester carboxylesterase
MQPQTVQVNSHTIAYYESAGKGRPALLVHGNSCSGLSYRRQLDSPLGEKHRLVAIDLPGHGDSQRAADPQTLYTLPGYAGIVSGAAERLGLDDAVFVGWSLGGHIILEASPQLPSASGFVIFGTPPLAFPPAMAEAFMPHPAMAAAFKAELTEAEMGAYVAAFFKLGTTDIPEAFKADVRRTDGQARAALAGSIRPGGYIDEIEVVAHLTAPLAVLHGEQEQLVNASYFGTLAMPTRWRGAVQVIPDAGHAPQWEQPERFNALLEAFIEECSR